MNALKGNSAGPNEAALAAQAAHYRAQGGQMENYLLSGTLPPGLQGTLNSAGDSATAAIRSGYASRGMSGSSAEAQDIANEQARLVSQGSQLAEGLFKQGLSESGMADGIYTSLMQSETQRDTQLGSAISGFGQALALMGQPVSAGG